MGSGSARIMLIVHFDTVFSKGEVAKRPFNVVGNKAFGPGVADAKGGVTMILRPLRLWRRPRPKTNKSPTGLCSSDKRRGPRGCGKWIEHGGWKGRKLE